MKPEAPPTPEQLAKTQARDLHGRAMAGDSPDVRHYNETLAKIRGSSRRSRFEMAYLRHHINAGSAKAVDLALEELEREASSAYPRPRREWSWQ